MLLTRKSLTFAATLIAFNCNLFGAEVRPLTLQKHAEGFVSPTVFTPLGGGGRMLLVDQPGVIYVVERDGKFADKPFLNITNRLTKLNQGFDERGLLGLALHPNFKSTRKFYVFYSAPKRASAPADWDCTSKLSEFQLKPGSDTEADPDSERVLLEIDKPYFNHNGGSISFGVDGLLYVSVGDGGNGNDAGRGHSPQGNGQDLTTWLGKILRIDVNPANGKPYGVPRDNPFLEGKARPEIWAYGIRNAWRMSFDRGGTHELFAADVGQDLFEEVDIIVRGGNYGWNVREGFHCFNLSDPKKPLENCSDKGADGKPFVDPILEYKHVKGMTKTPDELGISITGGFVYRGKAIPELDGKYIFGDWSRYWVKGEGVIFAASRAADKNDKKWSFETLNLQGGPEGHVNGYVVAFGQDEDGEVYVLTNNSNMVMGKSGKAWKLVPGGKI